MKVGARVTVGDREGVVLTETLKGGGKLWDVYWPDDNTVSTEKVEEIECTSQSD